MCNNRKKFRLDPEHSKFDDCQKLRLQENTIEIPSGNTPRT